MSRTTLFAKLRRVAAACRAARAEGITGPAEVLAWMQQQQSTRRAFTQRVGVGAGAFAIAGCKDSDEGEDDGGGDGVRVAIIGGGMAGLHCAHRLRESGVDATVYEASDRVGGRIFSARGMFADDQVAELGGELIDSVHATMFDLAEEFGIQIDDREETNGPDTVIDTWWVAGAAVPEATVVMQFAAVAGLMADLVEMADTDDAAYEMLDVIPLSTWLADNVPPATYPELHAILDTAYLCEYGLENDQQSCLNLLYLIGSDTSDEFRIFGISDERYHTHLGNDTFTTALADALAGNIETSMVLRRAADGDNGFTLTFDGPDGEVEVTAEHVVFALPFTRLRAVDLGDLTLSDDKREVIDTVGYGTNAKIMGGFTSRVWRTQHDATGNATTDLPAQILWDTSIGQPGDSGLITNFTGGNQGVASGEGEPEAWFTSVALPALETVYPGSEAAYVPGSAVRMHWPTHPFTMGSYACYRPGEWRFYGLEGEREGNLHFCGEHTSLEFQGFMEGAAETGMLVAIAILDELGIEPSRLHRAMADRKLVLPHPIVHGRLPQRPRFVERQRALLRPAAQVLARRAGR